MKTLFPHLQRFGKSLVIPLCAMPFAALLMFISHLSVTWFPLQQLAILTHTAELILSLIPLFVSVGIAMEYTRSVLFAAFSVISCSHKPPSCLFLSMH